MADPTRRTEHDLTGQDIERDVLANVQIMGLFS
jgi:hypothetical protein